MIYMVYRYDITWISTVMKNTILLQEGQISIIHRTGRVGLNLRSTTVRLFSSRVVTTWYIP